MLRVRFIAVVVVPFAVVVSACGDDPAPAGSGSGLLGTTGNGSTFSAAVKQGKATYYDYSGAG
ncbi:MAG: hypothetical protein JWO86_3246, partial [Myxococcaceae bacterium]|nr:hypothetical protein [Myxococcaceae bacterium]